ncbi:hypothetical protein GCK72_000717 [Caenorhabditis remanei]|uniref:Uncharacterized protein n=1 Tax=Caenorhabditis remanei TaxID=31234 RepID=A0A6A5HQL5_CAERE|nr:hypothetical protein GCK72_000717 [Caenorhabditis remanei]KAF1768904.1 hypothetical protein GCK72_000717 [Caenorhabditis remanei]
MLQSFKTSEIEKLEHGKPSNMLIGVTHWSCDADGDDDDVDDELEVKNLKQKSHTSAQLDHINGRLRLDKRHLLVIVQVDNHVFHNESVWIVTVVVHSVIVITTENVAEYLIVFQQHVSSNLSSHSQQMIFQVDDVEFLKN